jgi:hypothetical protein
MVIGWLEWKNMDGCRVNPLEGGGMVECVHCNVEAVPLKNICESIKYQWFWIPKVIDDKGFGDHLYNIPKAKLRGIM